MTPESLDADEPPLGRYEPAVDGELHEVVLMGLPLRLLAAGKEHHDGVMREFAMLALDEDLPREHIPARLLELVDLLGRRYGAATARPEKEIDEALARGERTVDVTYHVPAHVTEAAAQLEALMAEADEFCRRQQLLTLERPKVLVDFAHWYLDEFRRQLAGEPPRAWAGPLDLP